MPQSVNLVLQVVDLAVITVWVVGARWDIGSVLVVGVPVGGRGVGGLRSCWVIDWGWVWGHHGVRRRMVDWGRVVDWRRVIGCRVGVGMGVSRCVVGFNGHKAHAQNN